VTSVEGRIASRIAGTYPLADGYHSTALAAEMERITGVVAGLVPEATGLGLGDSSRTIVVSRAEWVRRNTLAFGQLLEPARLQIEERLAAAGKGPSSDRIRAIMESEMTVVLALLSRRVLGQYELVLPGGESGDMVAYVGANILQLERKHQFRPSEFRFWVALHEMTHRAQFQGVPWLRGYFMGLVGELVDQSKPEAGRLARVLGEIGDRRTSGRPVVDERGLLGLFATPEQNEVVDRVQALMSLLEGHGHVVMDRVGAGHLRSQDRMSRVLKARRYDRRTAALMRLTGLEMKMRQYRQGERFVLEIERRAGWDTVGLAFTSPGHLPDLAEIESPQLWLRRVA
jgi:coenzyme F420 biosynthesis associated uncharacterized protein